MSSSDSMHRQVAFPVSDNGTEVLWCEAMSDGDYQVLNAPVFAFGVSVGSRIKASSGSGGVLHFDQVSHASAGATIRCYFMEGLMASRSYLGWILPGALERELRVGPATFFDPDIVSIHIRDRGQLPLAIGYLDDLVRSGVLRFWELSDPVPDQLGEADEGTNGEPWELVHPFPDGQAISVAAR